MYVLQPLYTMRIVTCVRKAFDGVYIVFSVLRFLRFANLKIRRFARFARISNTNLKSTGIESESQLRILKLKL